MPETWRDTATRTAQDLVADEAVILVGDRTEITAELKVREGEMVTTPTPQTSTDRECREAVRTVGMEVGRRRENGLIGGMGKNIFVRPFH